MSRNLDPTMLTALSSGLISPVIMAILTFKSSTQYIWSGVGNLIYNGNTYIGVGSLGKIGAVSEGVTVQAEGTTITLSGIDSALLSDSLIDIQPGAPAVLYFALMTNGVLVGSPYQLFKGTMDSPIVNVGAKTISITISLENKMIDLSRPSCRRYTSADQRLQYPTDSGFQFVEQLSDLALNWGE
jgi:hypothetical protein